MTELTKKIRALNIKDGEYKVVSLMVDVKNYNALLMELGLLTKRQYKKINDYYIEALDKAEKMR